MQNTSDSQLEIFKRKYKNTQVPIQISFRELCSNWSWAKRSEVYTHQMHYYPAKILPYIPIYFLSSKHYASQNETVLDPFAGTGTVLLESIIHPFFKRNVMGIEINPLVRLIAKVKTTPLNITKLKEASAKLMLTINNFSGQIEIPNFTNINLWFSPRIQTELAKIKTCIEQVEDPNFKDFFFVCFSSIIRSVSFADPMIPPPVLLNPNNFMNNPDKQKHVESLLRKKKWAKPILYFKKKIKKNIERVESLSNLYKLDNIKVKSEIIWDDARELKKGDYISVGKIDKHNAVVIPDSSIGLIITSPPYINAQKYIRTTKLELLWLGLGSESEIIELDRNLVGTERVRSDEYNNLKLIGIDSADNIIKCIYEKDKRKAYIVSKYFTDMRQAMKETYRVLKKNGRYILVIGDNSVSSFKVENHKILTDIAIQDIGFNVETIFVDRIRSRGMITKRHETGGLVLDEWIIVLTKGN